ncbi:MAG: cystathionine gamma-synthase family protein [Thermovirgaceae bacterium]|nr:cystathionine gamma-synthase family protein [Thermovirgaceae bacterium]
MRDLKNVSKGTLAVWGGEEEIQAERSTQVPVFLGAAHAYEDLDEWIDVSLGKRPGHIYGRNTNPTVQAFEEKVRLLEGAGAATSAASGMGAISSVLCALLSSGDRAVSVKDTYGGTSVMFTEFLPGNGVECVLCDTTDHEAIEAEIAKGCTLLYLETPTNPTIKIIDIARLAKAGHAVGAVVVADNTFATPINQNPLDLGVDLVMHSATKYLGGHADALGGVVCGRADLVKKVYHHREIHGAALAPMSAYLLLRGMKTLSLRVSRQNENAMAIARFLETHPKIEQVFYPGLESHPGHEIARRQMRGFGGMMSFTLKGNSLETVQRFLSGLDLCHKAANLGAVETIAGIPATTSHVECTPEERKALGIPESLVRYSVGIEDVKDLIEDLTNALTGV